MRPVLFISHDASRTGAPLALVLLTRWLARHHPRPFEFVLGDGGDLLPEFVSLAPTTVIGSKADPLHAGARLAHLSGRIAGGEFSLLYANTVEAGDLLAACASRATPILSHVHELEFWIRQHAGPGRMGAIRDLSDHVIAVSNAVVENLATGHDIDRHAMSLVHECVDASRWSALTPARPALLQHLGIPATARIIGGAGTLDWRKGPDLFVQVAGAVQRRELRQPVHWVWVGGPSTGEACARLRHDARHLGVSSLVHFVGAQDDPAPFFSSFDVFLSTSREDPFPIVNLEAAAAAVPVVCFEGAGGAPEFVEQDAGAVVPYLDVQAMARSVVQLLSCETLRQQYGARARVKVHERHDLSQTAPRLAGLIETVAANGPTPERLARMAVREARQERLPWPQTDAQILVGVYRLASAAAAAGQLARARALFETVVDCATDADLSGKAWFKLATLTASSKDAARCCETALRLMPGHRAARQMLDDLGRTDVTRA